MIPHPRHPTPKAMPLITGLDALCGSTLMIGIDELIEEGLLPRADKPKKIPVTTVDYKQVGPHHCCGPNLLFVTPLNTKLAYCMLHNHIGVLKHGSLMLLTRPEWVPSDNLRCSPFSR